MKLFSDETKLRLQFAVIAWVVISPVVLVLTEQKTLKQFESSSWPSVQGEVLERVANPVADPNNFPKFVGRVRYRYRVGESDYETDLTDLVGGRVQYFREEALADVRRFQPNTIVPVYYNPQNPKEAVLEVGVPLRNLAFTGGLLASWIAAMLGSIFIIRSWRRGRNHLADS